MKFGFNRRLAIGILFFLAPLMIGADDLRLTKLVLQLEPASQTRTCEPLGDFSCDDNLGTPSRLNVNGSVYTPYYLYFIAVDVDTKVGLSKVSFQFLHDNLPFEDWKTCADQEVQMGWPRNWSGIILMFDTCEGTQPDPSDPEGDGSVILGSLYIYADHYGSARISPYVEEVPPTVFNCQGDSTLLARIGPDHLVALGEIGFGGPVVPGCEFEGVVDDWCAAGESQWTVACCMPDSICGPDQSQVSERACTYAGGIWRWVRCNPYFRCYGNVCGKDPVPAHMMTWGRIKARY